MPRERPILRLLDPRDAPRQPGQQPRLSFPRGPGRRRQGERLGASFAELTAAVQRVEGGVALAENPAGIAPDRALVFVTAGSIQNFARAARDVELEVIGEFDLEDTDEIPEGFTLARGKVKLSRALYATMPNLRSAEQILALWRAHQENEDPLLGAAPWWNLFNQLIELRVWGPEDRLPISVREALAEKLAGAADGDPVRVELEIWPSANENDRGGWREEAEAKVLELGGEIIDRSSISERRFIYEALLARIPAGAIRALLDDPNAPNGLAWVRGLQFILPQTVAQAPRELGDEAGDNGAALAPFNANGPIRAVLLDGLPVAAHPALDGGVVVEDVHELAFRSLVRNRMHGTAMASLILRGDLISDRVPVPGSRLLSVPIVVDLPDGGRSPEDMLFVDVIHTALARLFLGDEPLAPDAFVVNLSIGMQERQFAGQISSLARLLDWWSSEHGVLFVASAGNIFDDLMLPDVGHPAFMAATADDRRKAVIQALKVAGYGRRLMHPAEAMNVLTVGAISEDLAPPDGVPRAADVVRLEADGRRYPALCSALGLGPFRSIKPDLLHSGGVHELRATADEAATRLALIRNAPSGLVVASPNFNATPLRRSRGTSCAAALTTRAVLQSADALVEEGGPYNGVALSRRDLALLTRALAVNATDWSSEALTHNDRTLASLGGRKYTQAKEDVARHFGHGYLFPDRMQQSPATGATLVGLGDVRKDRGKIFDLPLPPSLSGDRVARAMRITIAWFSPVTPARARYRLAALRAIAADRVEDLEQDRDSSWGLLLKSDGPDRHMIARGTVWTRRLVNNRLACPAFDEGQTIPIRVQCQDASGGGLDPDLNIRFAVVVTLQVEAQVDYDILAEVRAQLEVRAGRANAVRI